MKRIIYYANVTIIAVCFIGCFAALFWLLSSTIMAKIFEAEFSIFTTLLFLSLYALLFLVLAMFMIFAVGFFVYRANILYKKRTRSFTLLRPNVTGEQKKSVFPSASYFAADLPGFGYFAPSQGLPFTTYGGPAPFAGQGGRVSQGKKPAGNKPRIALVIGGRAAAVDPPKAGPEALSPGLLAGKGARILPFPKKRKDRRKR
jgi:hypothetical protein